MTEWNATDFAAKDNLFHAVRHEAAASTWIDGPTSPNVATLKLCAPAPAAALPGCPRVGRQFRTGTLSALELAAAYLISVGQHAALVTGARRAGICPLHVNWLLPSYRGTDARHSLTVASSAP